MQPAAIVLAAGASTRFGSSKQLVRIEGRTMLEMIATTASEAGLRPILAVVPPGLAVPPSIVPVLNDDPGAGISRSLRLGIGAVPAELDAAVILLGDEPTIPVDAIDAVLSAARDGASVVASSFGDRVGPPVFLRRERFDVALEARGDEGLGPLLRGRSDVALVALDAVPIDVDSVADLARLRDRN